MKKLKLSLLFYFLLIGLQSAQAQLQVLHKAVNASLIQGGAFSQQFQENFWKLSPDKRNILFSLVIETEAKGNVMAVNFSNPTIQIDSIFSRERVLTYLNRENTKAFSRYKNGVFVIHIWLRDKDNPWIDMKSLDLKYYDELIPDNEGLTKGKKIFLLPTLRLFVTEPRP